MAHEKWTIMMYLSGESNLSPEMVRAISDVGQSRLPSDVVIIIQYVPRSRWFPTLRYVLPIAAERAPRQHVEGVPLAQALVGQLRTTGDTSDPRALAEFIRWSVTEFPSDHRMLILSGHSGGAVADLLTEDESGMPRPGYLTVARLRNALETTQKSLQNGSEGLESASATINRPAIRIPLVDILGLDTCVMGMVEVCYELREFVRFLVGSEGFVPNTGWPYRYLLEKVLERAEANASSEPSDLCRDFVDDFLDFYTDYLPAGVSVDIAACELSKTEDVAIAVRELASCLCNALDHEEVQNLLILSHWRAQSFKLEQYTDLWDFCGLLAYESDKRQAEPLFTSIAQACKRVQSSIEFALGKSCDTVDGIRQGFVGADFQHAHGLSIHFPWSCRTLED